MKQLLERVSAALAPLVPAGSSLLIGLSGGVDSVVLLHILQRLAQRFSWQLAALHVHHGISSNADAWAEFCTGFCAKLGVALHMERVDIAPLRDHGIEAAARKLRHAAFAKQACDFILLAQHADDQAETLLLQLLRGAGVRGAGAMPVGARQLNALKAWGCVLRPLLGSTREEILAYAAACELRWIEDESNADESYPRNFLRHQLLPLLQKKFPAYRETLCRSAQHFAEAAELQDDLARLDAVTAILGETLAVSALQAHSTARAKNLLRYFLQLKGAPMPQAAQLEAMLQQLCDARVDASLCVAYGGWQVRRYRGQVYAFAALTEPGPVTMLHWQGEAALYWPLLSARLDFIDTQGAGISLAKLQHQPVTLRARAGGESLRPQRQAATRSLKNLLQERHIPPWQRERLPLLYSGDTLVCITGVAIAADYQAASDEPGVVLRILQDNQEGVLHLSPTVNLFSK